MYSFQVQKTHDQFLNHWFWYSKGTNLQQRHDLLEVQKLERDLPQVAGDFPFYYKAHFNSALLGITRTSTTGRKKKTRSESGQKHAGSYHVFQ